MSTLKSVLQSVSTRNLTNVQKVALKLLSNAGEWVPSSALRKITNAPTRDASSARVRELRSLGFKVECQSAAALNRSGNQYTFFYKISPSNVKATVVRELFGV